MANNLYDMIFGSEDETKKQEENSSEQPVIDKVDPFTLSKVGILPEQNVQQKLPPNVTPAQAPASIPQELPKQEPLPISIPKLDQAPQLSKQEPLQQAPQKPAAQIMQDLFGADLNDDALKQAQNERRMWNAVAGLGKATTQLIAPTAKTGFKLMEDIEQGSGRAVDDLLQRRKGKMESLDAQKRVMELASDQEKNDPNSPVSKIAQQAITKMGNLTGTKFDTQNMSAASIEKLFGPLEKLATAINATEARKTDQQVKQAGKLSEAEKAVDKTFAKEYDTFVVGGGYANLQKGLKQLAEAKEALRTKNITGPIVGRTPDFINSIINPEAISNKEAVQEVVQRSLREVLGAQFTEKEGKALMERAYNPALSEEENSKRIDRLIQQLSEAGEAKRKAAEYYEEHGTLKGYKGTKLVKSADEFLKDAKPSKKSQSQEAVSTPKTEHIGRIVEVKGKKYRVSEDGDTLIPM